MGSQDTRILAPSSAVAVIAVGVTVWVEAHPGFFELRNVMRVGSLV
jgi:hypothetical protein